MQHRRISMLIAANVLLLGVKNICSSSADARGVAAFIPHRRAVAILSRGAARAPPYYLQMSMSASGGDDGMYGHGGKETLEPLRSVREGPSGAESGDDVLRERQGDDDGSEDNNPRRGRPGIVVFSGGTAFNAASAEMASRNVGAQGKLDQNEALSRSNSMSSLIDLMAVGGMDEKTSSDQAGGMKVWHVLPVTDDGGSTAEIVRVLGGPAVGDIRSRLLRLAPGTTREARAVRRLLGHRLVSMQTLEKKDCDDAEVTHEMISRMAREEWLDILDGGHESYQQPSRVDEGGDGEQSYEHPLWKDVSAPYRSIIRAFLVHFHTQVLQTHNGIRQSHSNPPFDFTGGSVGNFFFAGARTFFGSLPAAIFLFSKVAGIPSGSRVIPAVLSDDRLVLGAELKDGTRIRSQFNISHPRPKAPPQLQQETRLHPQSSTPRVKNQRELCDSGRGASIGRHRQVVKKASFDSEEAISSLHPAQISKIAYLLNDPTWSKKRRELSGTASWSDRHVVSPEPNPLALDAISNTNCIVYGCGSLFTSVLPSLVLEGVGTAIASRSVPKVLLLNGWHDSETTWTEPSSNDDGKLVVKRMDATSFVKAVVGALSQDHCRDRTQISTPLVTDFITHIFYPAGTEITIDEQSLATLCDSRQQIQVKCIKSNPAEKCSEGSRSVFNPRALVDALLDLAC